VARNQSIVRAEKSFSVEIKEGHKIEETLTICMGLSDGFHCC
jgi:hypothetical protein